jgi:hypothetical protein
MEEFIIKTEAKSGARREDCLRKADLPLEHTQLAGAIIKAKTVRQPCKASHLRFAGKGSTKGVGEADIHKDTPHNT